MPDRIIRDELLESDRWLSLSRNTHRLAFVCLITAADALGNMEGTDARLWRLWRDPLKLDDRKAISEILESLVCNDLVRLYEVDGKRLIHIPRYKQRLRYLGRINPPSPWTTNEQKQQIAKNSPGDSQARTGRAPAEVDVDVEVKRKEEVLQVKTVLQNLTGKGTPSPTMSRDEQLAFIAKQAKGKA